MGKSWVVGNGKEKNRERLHWVRVLLVRIASEKGGYAQKPREELLQTKMEVRGAEKKSS